MASSVVHVVQAERRKAAVRVPRFGILDLDDLGSPFPEHGSRHGDEDVRGHLEHPYVGERRVHSSEH